MSPEYSCALDEVFQEGKDSHSFHCWRCPWWPQRALNNLFHRQHALQSSRKPLCYIRLAYAQPMTNTAYPHGFPPLGGLHSRRPHSWVRQTHRWRWSHPRRHRPRPGVHHRRCLCLVHWRWHPRARAPCWRCSCSPRWLAPQFTLWNTAMWTETFQKQWTKCTAWWHQRTSCYYLAEFAGCWLADPTLDQEARQTVSQFSGQKVHQKQTALLPTNTEGRSCPHLLTLLSQHHRLDCTLSTWVVLFCLPALGLSCSMWDLIPQPRTEPRPPALGAFIFNLKCWEWYKYS